MKTRLLAVGVALAMVGALGCTPPNPGGGGTPPATNTDTLDLDGLVVDATVAQGETVLLEPVDSGALPPTPADFDTPFGAFRVTVSGVTAGSIASVDIEFSTAIEVVHKLIDGTWDLFEHDGSTGAQLSPDGLTLTLDLQDGGRGDTDGTADGKIVDPILPSWNGLRITTDALPIMTNGQPYSEQLQASGATGTQHWSVIDGMLPEGITLDDSGLLSGTSSAETSGSEYVRVQVTDDTRTKTKLLFVLRRPGVGPSLTSTGVALPEGSRLMVSARNADGLSMASYLANGTITPIDSMSVLDLGRTFASDTVNRAGTQAIMSELSNNGPPTGPIKVVAGSTGALLATLESSDSIELYSSAFSPNGAYLAIATHDPDTSEQLIKIFDTQSWDLTRTIPAFNPSIVWSPDSTRLIADYDTSTGNIYAATDPSGFSDYTIPAPSWDCTSRDWAGGRILFDCGHDTQSSVRTASDIDGSDARVVATSTCAAGQCTIYGSSQGAPSALSSSGGQVVFCATVVNQSDMSAVSARVGIASDANNAPISYLVEPVPVAPSIPIVGVMGSAWLP